MLYCPLTHIFSKWITFTLLSKNEKKKYIQIHFQCQPLQSGVLPGLIKTLGLHTSIFLLEIGPIVCTFC